MSSKKSRIGIETQISKLMTMLRIEWSLSITKMINLKLVRIETDRMIPTKKLLMIKMRLLIQTRKTSKMLRQRFKSLTLTLLKSMIINQISHFKFQTCFRISNPIIKCKTVSILTIKRTWSSNKWSKKIRDIHLPRRCRTLNLPIKATILLSTPMRPRKMKARERKKTLV